MLHGILIPLVVGIRIFANSFLNVFQKRLIAAVPNALEINFVMYLLLSLGMLPFAPAFPFGTLPPEFWFWAALVGIAGSCGNACMVKALERGELVQLHLQEIIPQRSICLVYDHHRPLNTAARKFQQLLTERTAPPRTQK